MSSDVILGGGDRWAKPANILEARTSTDVAVQFPDGRVFADVDIVADDETIERMSEGWVCGNCFEPQREAFPESCSIENPMGIDGFGCGYKIRERQPRDLKEKTLPGMVRLGSTVSLSDEVERMTEMDEYERRTGLKLPDSVKFPTGRV